MDMTTYEQLTATVVPSKNEDTNLTRLPAHCLGAPDRIYNDTYTSNGYSYEVVVVLSVLVAVFCLYALIGNVGVIVVIFRDRVISSQPHNQYLVSLAVADALLAVLIVPFTLVNELSGAWPFGRIYCNIYLAADVLFCTASIWGICAIGLDRYWSVKQPITNRRKRTKKAIRLIILMVWALSFAISVPPFIFGFKTIPISNEKSCFISNEEWYILFSSTLSFFLPAVIIAPVYTKIYLIGLRHSRPPKLRNDSYQDTRNRDADFELMGEPEIPVINEINGNGENAIDNPRMPLSSSCNSLEGLETTNPYLIKSVGQENLDYACLYSTKNGRLTLPAAYQRQLLSDNTAITTEIGLQSATSAALPVVSRTQRNEEPAPQKRKRFFSAASTHSAFSMSSMVVFFKRRSQSAETEAMSKRAVYYHKKEMRFTLIICLVTGGFLLCWYPFFQTYVVYVLCGKACCIDKNAFKLIFWLGYLNSGLNPAIYTIFNKEFRRAFRRLFCGRGRGKAAWFSIFHR